MGRNGVEEIKKCVDGDREAQRESKVMSPQDQEGIGAISDCKYGTDYQKYFEIPAQFHVS